MMTAAWSGEVVVVVKVALGAALLKTVVRTRENRPRAVEEEARMIARAATRTGTIIRGRLLRGRGLGIEGGGLE